MKSLIEQVYGPSWHASPTGGEPGLADTTAAPSVMTEIPGRHGDPALALVVIAALALAAGWVGAHLTIRVGAA